MYVEDRGSSDRSAVDDCALRDDLDTGVVSWRIVDADRVGHPVSACWQHERYMARHGNVGRLVDGAAVVAVTGTGRTIAGYVGLTGPIDRRLVTCERGCAEGDKQQCHKCRGLQLMGAHSRSFSLTV